MPRPEDSRPHVLIGPAGRRTVMLANWLAGSGHAVFVVLDPARAAADADLAALDRVATVVELVPPTPGHWYFCDDQADADRVFETLIAGGWQHRPAVLNFVGCAALAITVVRARRLLGLFRTATIETDDPEPDAGAAPGTLPEVFTRWAAVYVHRQAKSVLNEPDADAGGRVSVVIPLYNQGQYLHEAIASVRRDPAGAEIVVVNDGSTDPATNEVFAGLTGVVKVEQENQGLSGARNAGIAHSTGTYVVPLDADDTIEPGFLATARRALDGNPELAYVVGYSQYTGLLQLTYAPAGFIPELNLFLHTHGKAPGMYRKASLQGVGGYDRQFRAFEDWEVQVTLHRAGHDTDVLPVVGHYYRRHAESMSFTVSNRIRHELVPQLMRKHLPMLGTDDLHTGMLVLAHLWKTAYEPSTSVLLQRSRPA